MNPLVLAGFLAFFVASLVVGVRLLLLWRRSRELPELLIGIGVLGIGPVGFGAMLLGVLLQPTRPQLAPACFAAGHAAVLSGILSQFLFIWRVYHPGSRLAAAVSLSMAAALVAIFGDYALVKGFAPPNALDAVELARSALQVGCLAWGSAEALRYWRLMSRRRRIGLADPVVTNRFLLWGVGTAAAGLGTAIGVAASLALGVSSLQIPWVVASSSAHGFVAAVAMWLAFVPTPAYLRYVQRAGAADVPAR